MTELEVKLSADIKELQDELKKAEASLKSFGKEAEDASEKTKDVGGEAGKAVPGLKDLKEELVNAAISFTSMAAVGDIAIRTFSQLEEDTGFLSRAITGLSKEEQVLAQNQRDLNKAISEGIGDIQAEIFNLNTLLGVAKDEAKSKETRLAAVDKINKQYPTFLGNLRLEEINSINTRKAVDDLTKSYIRQATIKPLMDSLSEAIGKQESLLRTNSEEAATFSDKFVAYMNPVYLLTGRVNERIKELGEMNKFLDFTSAGEEIRGLKDRIKELTEIELTEFGFFSKAGKVTSKDLEQIRKDFIASQKKIAANLSKSVTESAVEFPKYIFGDRFLKDAFAISPEAQEDLVKQAIDTTKKISDAVNKQLQDASKPVKGYLSEIELALNEFNERADSIIKTNISNTFAGFGQVLGEGLINGGEIFQSLGKVLLGGLGSVLIQLGELAIATGVGLLAVQTALSTLNPAVAIGAGIALVAIGSAFSAGAASLGKTGSTGSFGGVDAVGSNSVAGQGSGGNISNSGSNFGASGSSGGTVVFEIQGQKLIGVLNRTLGANKSLGGNLSLG